MTDAPLTAPALGLMFLLGLRHGLDPDHVAVIDNIVFRSVDQRSSLSRWTGTLFAVGHNLAVAGVALGVSLLAGQLVLPAWFATGVDIAVFALLVLVGTLNLMALCRRHGYVPVGWRAKILPVSLRTNTHPLAVIVTGLIFGLVFDTATQAAAWGAAASTRGGIAAVASIMIVFAAGMIITDTLDSQIVSRLLRSRDATGAAPGVVKGAVVQRYRRAVGWLIVGLSYAMALVDLLEMTGHGIELDDATFTFLGVGAALAVVALLAGPRFRAVVRSRTSS
ncbi:HoxN/HupN/NixA family nickel/cobalt transporter [Nitrospirillum pindoramense]|uniref:Nickel/cobalt efflux system n=1 Tax=Nitrospirillum amazonense TaxID=28077 RepID=A0A560GYJ6_9PROT|nr:nickel permease [Nitrospirillum amazonense]TWB39092.1 high-affinity nickel-transport protein [Nitrospirillum amazonense]